MRAVLLFLALIALFPLLASGATYLVTPDGTGDFPTVQAAIDAVVAGDVVQLADGIFTGDGNRDLDLLGKAITIESQSGDPALCVLDCQGSPQEPHRGILFRSQEGRATVVHGITVTNAYTPALGQSETWGAAMYCGEWAGPTITNCVLTMNSVHYVCGGLMCDWNASPLVADCVFSDNFGFGAGMFVSGGDTVGPTVTDCLFTGNVADQDLGMEGGGICFGGGRVCGTYARCVFIANVSGSSGGGGIRC